MDLGRIKAELTLVTWLGIEPVPFVFSVTSTINYAMTPFISLIMRKNFNDINRVED